MAEFGEVSSAHKYLIAEALSINLSEPMINRDPYSSLVGGLITFIPRDWIPWKLYGASVESSP